VKKKTKSKAIKDLYLDRPTSHGGWPGGHSGSYRDPNTPVYKQIAQYLKDMGLADDDNPRARLSESPDQFNMYQPLSLQEPLNKAIKAIIDIIKNTNSAEDLHAQAYQMMMLLSQVILIEAPISEKQSFYLAAAILRYHNKMVDYKELLKKQFEDNRHKTGNWSGTFFDSPDMDKWRDIDAKQVEFHREVESMIGTKIEHQGTPDIDHYVVYPYDIDDLRSKFVSAGLANSNDGTFVGRYGNPPSDLDKSDLYSKAFYHGENRYFVNENLIRNIIRESIKRYL
tara:strand:+ start:3560 stop:4408 length:849 start_codon:yes stop_codon:yes gene_type:complete